MTTSNRFLNRAFLLVTGIVLLAVGVFLTVVALPGGGFARSWVTDAAGGQRQALAHTLLDTSGIGGETGGSYLPWALAVLCLVVVIVALVAATTRGRGRTDRVVEVDESAGRITVSSRFAETALVDALSPRRDVASVGVSAYELKGAPALKIRLRVTAGSSPVAAVHAAADAVSGLDRVLGGGAAVPVLVEVVGASPIRPGADSRVR